MPIKRAACLVCLTVGAVVALAPASASAQSAITEQTMFGTAEPYLQDQVVYGPASLRVVWDTTYASGFSTQTMSDANIHFDNDFAFDTTGIGQCPGATLAGTTTAAAIAACPTAVLGTGGNAVLTGTSTSFSGDVTSFNGAPAGGSPVIYLHVRIGAPANITMVLTGTLGPSARGGDFGSQIFFIVPDTAATGTDLTHMDARFDMEPEPGRFFFTARCFDADHYWNYAGDFAFRAGGGFVPAAQVQQCNHRTITTLAPLVFKPKRKKCKKKRGAGAAKKCKKRR